MRRALALTLACLTLSPAPALAGGDHAALRRSLAGSLRAAGPGASAFVLDVSERDRIVAVRDRRSRILASNTKLFITAAALAELGPLETAVLGTGELLLDGTWEGDLYLKGGGDPTFGSAGFVASRYGSAATVEELAAQLQAAGIVRVRGRVVGDESAFDPLRGPIGDLGGPLSALAFDHGRKSPANPPEFAAARLDDALEERGVAVRSSPRPGAAPAEARRLAAVSSPPLARLVRITNKPSSNFFAEMLAKRLGLTVAAPGTTQNGARVAEGFAGRLGARVRLADGSGLSRADRGSPRAVVELLDELRAQPFFPDFFQSLSIAGVDGTLAEHLHRGLRSGPAKRRCRGKTGTLSGVSAVSGYCRALSGDTIVFSILSNGVNAIAMKRIEDRMLQAMARYG